MTEKKPLTKAEKNGVVIKYLVELAALCVIVSVGVVLLGVEDTQSILQITFMPVTTIVAGLIGYLKS